MFRGQNWARWLALLWMAFHVAISFPVVRQVVTHSIIFALIACGFSFALTHGDISHH